MKRFYRINYLVVAAVIVLSIPAVCFAAGAARKVATYTGIFFPPEDGAPFRMGSINGNGETFVSLLFPIGTDGGQIVTDACDPGDICSITGIASRDMFTFDAIHSASKALSRDDYSRGEKETDAHIMRRLEKDLAIFRDLTS